MKFRTQFTHGHEGSDFLSVLDELHSNTFSNGRIRLFGFNANFFEDYSFRMRWATSGWCFENVSKGPLFVAFVGLELKLIALCETNG